MKYLWSRPEYQFFPIILLGCLVLFWQRQPDRSVALKWYEQKLELTLRWLALFSMAAAFALFSRSMGALAAVLASGSLLLRYRGEGFWQQIFPAWLLLWLLLPPPLALDTRLSLSLQQLTARCSTAVLDAMAVPHLMEGTCLELPSRRLLIEEACSGIHSMISLIACAGLFGVSQCCSAAGILRLVMSGIFWAAGFNVVRVVAIGIASEYLGFDLSTGWQHETLGVLMFASAIGMVYSSEHLCRFAWPGSIPSIPAESAAASVSSGGAAAIRDERGLWISTALFVCIGVAQVGLLSSGRDALWQDQHAACVQAARAVDARSLEPTPSDQSLQFTESDGTPRESGSFSRIWIPAGTPVAPRIALDYPFGGWHELTVCYGNQGWELLNRQEVHDADTQWPTVAAEFSRSTGEFGYLLFAMFDLDGRPMVSPTSEPLWKSLIARFRTGPVWRLLGNQGVLEYRGNDQTGYQVQLFVVSAHPLSETARESLRTQFLDARRRLREQCLAGRRAP